MNNLASNGKIEDIAVARDQKGKRMGLRILESLVHFSTEAGCHKVISKKQIGISKLTDVLDYCKLF